MHEKRGLLAQAKASADRNLHSELLRQCANLWIGKVLADDELAQIVKIAISEDLNPFEEDLIKITVDGVVKLYLPLVARSLKSENPFQSNLLEVLTLFAAQEYSDDIGPFLSSASSATRKQACLALGKMGAEKWAGPVAGQLNDPEVDVSQAAVVALGKLKSAPHSVELLEIALDRQRDPLSRRLALRSLSEIGASKFESTYVDLLEDPDDGIKEDAIKVLTCLKLFGRYKEIGKITGYTSLLARAKHVEIALANYLKASGRGNEYQEFIFAAGLPPSDGRGGY